MTGTESHPRCLKQVDTIPASATQVLLQTVARAAKPFAPALKVTI